MYYAFGMYPGSSGQVCYHHDPSNEIGGEQAYSSYGQVGWTATEWTGGWSAGVEPGTTTTGPAHRAELEERR